MINIYEVLETNKMIEKENLDVRTITLGISLLDCIDSNLDKLNENIYTKIKTVAKDLVATGEAIEKEFGIPIVNNGQSSQGSRCQSDRRIFSTGNQGHDQGR